jgi:hypothetical protein
MAARPGAKSFKETIIDRFKGGAKELQLVEGFGAGDEVGFVEERIFSGYRKWFS